MDSKLLLEHKRKYGRIFKLNLEKQDVYFRPLTVRELRHVDGKTGIDEEIASIVILNDVKLTLPGSFIALAKFVQERSIYESEDDLELKALENRKNVRDSFALMLITKLCAFFPYKPDELMDKTIDQLMELAAIAEIARGENLIGKQPKGPPDAMPSLEERDKFQQPDSQELMDESVNALDAEMKKHGKEIPKFDKADPHSELDPLHRQMKELSDVDA